MKKIWVVLLTVALVLSSAPLAMAQEPIEPLTPPPTSGSDQMINETPESFRHPVERSVDRDRFVSAVRTVADSRCREHLPG
jgi:hypothetical protein